MSWRFFSLIVHLSYQIIYSLSFKSYFLQTKKSPDYQESLCKIHHPRNNNITKWIVEDSLVPNSLFVIFFLSFCIFSRAFMLPLCCLSQRLQASLSRTSKCCPLLPCRQWRQVRGFACLVISQYLVCVCNYPPSHFSKGVLSRFSKVHHLFFRISHIFSNHSLLFIRYKSRFYSF